MNFNGLDHLPACLDAARAAADGLAREIVVVDNGSSDGSVEWISRQPDVTLAAEPSNGGFARGMNRGMAAATGRVLLWLNPDCLLEPSSLAPALRHLDALGRPALLGPRLLDASGLTQPSALAFNSPGSAVLHVLGLRGLFRFAWVRAILSGLAGRVGGGFVGDYLSTRSGVPQERSVDWLTGACLLVSRGVAERIGPLDESFFMYSEDEAWCRQAACLGVDRIWYPTWVAHHGVGQSGRGSPYIRCHYYRSLWLYHRKWGGAGRLVAWPALWLMCVLKGSGCALCSLVGEPHAGVRAWLWFRLAGWMMGLVGEPCGPVPPPAWPPGPEGQHVRG